MNLKNIRDWTVAAGLVAACGAVYAGVGGTTPGGTEFEDIWELIQGWSQGVLGRILALGALIVGIAFGLIRQSVVAAVVGISMAIIFQYGPDVIEGVVTSTAADATPAQVLMLDNSISQVVDLSKPAA